MTVARKLLVSLVETPYYHVVSRCVRRSFLCGFDRFSGRSYEHRRGWIVERVKFLAGVFAVDVCAYAVMSNHYHLVLKVGNTSEWSVKRVLHHWGSLCALPLLCQRFVDGDALSAFERDAVSSMAEVYRVRLMDLSWFMKLLNQDIALRANAEDNVKGHFWESRFKSQALLDERALLTCMAYADLNPIRAGMARTPEHSDYTSIQERIKSMNTDLLAFGHAENTLPYALSDYLDLVDLTGRAILENKRGFIPNELPPILEKLGLSADTWLKELNQFKTAGYTAVGTVSQIKNFCRNLGKRWAIGFQLTTALE